MDLLQFEKRMPEEAKAIRLTIEKMAMEKDEKGNNLLHRLNEWHIKEEFPRGEIVRMFNKAGLFGLDPHIGEEYGCQKVSYLVYGLFCEMLEGIGSELRSFFSVNTALVRSAISKFGSDWQKDTYLKLLSDGSYIGCFGLTGAHGGSDPKWMEERAVIDKCKVILNGNKNWITNATIADVAVVWMQTGKVGDHKTIRGFIVENRTTGFEAHPIKTKMGLRASDTGMLSFQNCLLRTWQSLLPTAAGLGHVYGILGGARYGIGWGAVGIAKACFNEAKKYAAEDRKVRDGYDNLIPLIEAPLTRVKFGRIGDRITTMQERAWTLADRIDEAGGINTYELSVAASRLKKDNVADAKYVVDVCRQIMGANGLLFEGDRRIARHYVNIPVVETYEGTEDIHEIILADYFAKN